MGSDWDKDNKEQLHHSQTETAIDARSSFAILIGINQYRSFQALNYATADAQAIQTFLINEAGFPPEQCLLLTDTSPSVWGRSTYPTRSILQSWLERFCRQYINPDATVWCFFCGHGAHENGQDYLLPIDAKPDDIAGTGIAIQFLFDNLQAAGAKTTLVFLDINHNHGSQTSQALGSHTTEVAQNSGISTFLSSRPNEFSCESQELRQGFFTTALLEGLRQHQCYSVRALEQYLNLRLPKLTDDYWRPIQHPICIIDGTAETHPPILPIHQQTDIASLDSSLGQVNSQMNSQTNGQTSDGYVVPLANNPSTAGATTIGQGNPSTASRKIETEVLPADTTLARAEVDFNGRQRLKTVASGLQPALYNSLLTQLVGNPRYSGSPEPQTHTVNGSYPLNYDSGEPSGPSLADLDRPALQPDELINRTPSSGLPSLATVNSHFSRYAPSPATSPVIEVPEGSSVLEQIESSASHSPPMAPSEPAKPASISTNEESDHTDSEIEDNTFRGQLLLWTAIVAAILLIGTVWRNQTAFRGVPQNSSGNPSPNSSQPSGPNPTSNLGLKISGQVSNRNAAKALVNSNSLTRLAPQSRTTPLQAARATLPNQPLKFREAIDRAKQVLPGQPQYNQAQVNIERWSWVIVDLAEGRAAAGDYPGAIAAARLVPNDQAEASLRARKLIAYWQTVTARPNKRAVLQTAQNQIQLNQASSYNQAIRIATQIQPTDPEYKQAQQQIDAWSQEIMRLANRRARQRNYRRAIETATLVPPNTAAYPAAQRAIRQWRRR